MDAYHAYRQPKRGADRWALLSIRSSKLQDCHCGSARRGITCIAWANPIARLNARSVFQSPCGLMGDNDFVRCRLTRR